MWCKEFPGHFLPLSSLFSLWLWWSKGLKWHRRHRVLYGLPQQLQQQSQMPVDHPGVPWQTGPPPFSQFLPGGESAVLEWQSQHHRQTGESRYVNICLLWLLNKCGHFQQFSCLVYDDAEAEKAGKLHLSCPPSVNLLMLHHLKLLDFAFPRIKGFSLWRLTHGIVGGTQVGQHVSFSWLNSGLTKW